MAFSPMAARASGLRPYLTETDSLTRAPISGLPGDIGLFQFPRFDRSQVSVHVVVLDAVDALFLQRAHGAVEVVEDVKGYQTCLAEFEAIKGQLPESAYFQLQTAIRELSQKYVTEIETPF